MEFGGLQIAFDSRLLTPRPWTQEQSRWAAALLPYLPAGDVLELCNGAGHIGLLAVAGSGRNLVCVDIDPVAAEYTRRNAGVAGQHVECRTGRPATVLHPDERFALIIADPPWVPRGQTERFPDDPLRAIDGGPDGLDVTRECLAAIAQHLHDDGVALLQLAPGDEQAEAVSALLAGTRLIAGERRSFERGMLVRIDAARRSDPDLDRRQ